MKRRLLTLLTLTVGLTIAGTAGAQQGDVPEPEIHVLPVRDNIYMLVGGGGNTTVQVGEDGVLVVDTKTEAAAPKLLETIAGLSDGPIRYVVNTHYHPDHTGGNAAVRAAGETIAGGNFSGDIADAGAGAAVIAHENTLFDMSAPTGEQAAMPPEAWPTSTFFNDKKALYFNGEPVIIRHQPNAHTNGDVIVFFRKSDVIATGDLFTTTNYPIIDVAKGGSINGVIEALNTIIDMIVPVYGQDGGAKVVPGHGRLSNIGDVINYREMVTIIRDRIQHYIDQGMTLEEVKAAKPTFDYDPRYGSDEGFWTTEKFIEAAYQTLSATD